MKRVPGYAHGGERYQMVEDVPEAQLGRVLNRLEWAGIFPEPSEVA